MAKIYLFSILSLLIYFGIEMYAFQAFRTVALGWSIWPRRITYFLYWGIVAMGILFWLMRMTGHFEAIPKSQLLAPHWLTSEK